MDCVELEDLCSKALEKMGLKLSATYGNGGNGKWEVLISNSQHGTNKVGCITSHNRYDIATAASIGEVANMLFNLYQSDSDMPYWEAFYWVGEDRKMHTIKNIFACKNYNEARIMIDLL